MKIIPAEKSTAAYFVSQQLQNLLGFGIHPDPEALSGAWLDAIKARIVETTDAAQRSFEGDAGACELLKSARRLAFQFAMLMHDRPKLSTIPVEEWNVESYRRLFDDLSAAERTIRTLSDKCEQPGRGEPAAEPDSEQENELGQLGHPKIVLPTDPDVADVWNTFQAVTVGTANVSEICREVAGKSGANAESLRKKFNRWKSKNIG